MLRAMCGGNSLDRGAAISTTVIIPHGIYLSTGGNGLTSLVPVLVCLFSGQICIGGAKVFPSSMKTACSDSILDKIRGAGIPSIDARRWPLDRRLVDLSPSTSVTIRPKIRTRVRWVTCQPPLFCGRTILVCFHGTPVMNGPEWPTGSNRSPADITHSPWCCR